MKVSIIIPYHKGEAYLRDCLDSLKEQCGQELELLLICDHVPRAELSFLAKYRRELPLQVHQLRNKTGVAAARNTGLDYATGAYVYFLDSDDYLIGNTLEALVQTATMQNADMVYGRKITTWYSRKVFLTHQQEKEQDQDEINTETQEQDEVTLEVQEQERDETKTDILNQYADKAGSLAGEQLSDAVCRKQEAYRLLVAKKKGVRNISVLHILWKRSFLKELHLRFLENLVYFSDVPFLLEALSKTDRIYRQPSARYIKRKHNDAINFPSLSQQKDPGRFYEFVETYYLTKDRIAENRELRNCFDRKYISYYTRVYATKLKRSKIDIWREENFIVMSKIIAQMDQEMLHALKGYQRRMVRALLRQDLRASLHMVRRHLAYQKLKSITKERKNLFKLFYIHLFLKLPVKDNWIMFESFFGKSYSDSPKYIYEYLSRNHPGKYRAIWVIDKRHTKIPYMHQKIRRQGFLYSYYLARCKYLVFNSRQPLWVIKREESVFLQTWHGTPLKKLVFDMDEITSASPRYKEQVYYQSRAWDYLIAPNSFSSVTFRRCFMYEGTLLETGYPRNDILHDPNREKLAKNIRNTLGIPKEKKTILYAPTWRDDEFYGKGQYKFELQLDLDKLRVGLKEDYVILLRTHYFIADSINVSAWNGFVVNVSKYDDISELYLISDILITDYSSVFFDYANLKRPMLFFTYDLENYRDMLRGFYFNIEKEVPGPLLYTTEEVIDAVNHIDLIHREYNQRYEEFYQRFCEWEDGHAAEKVVKSVFVDH